MRFVLPLVITLAGCWGEDAHIIEGTVVSVAPPVQVVLDHKAVPGLMGPMVMPFDVADPALLKGVEPGHVVITRFEIGESGGKITKLRITGKVDAPPVVDQGPEPVRHGAKLPGVDVETASGSLRIGEDQRQRVALAFLYTRCPLPDYCPAVMLRLSQLERELSGDALLVAVTLDPEYDTLPVLAEFAASHGAVDGKIRLARTSAEAVADLAIRAGLPVLREGNEVVHGLRLLVLDADGTLIERYDDNAWPISRVRDQLLTGEPRGPLGVSGTVTPSR